MNIISGHYPSERGSCEPYVTVELGCPWFRDDITYWCPTCGLHRSEHPEREHICRYCGPGPCRSSAWTSNGRDVERFERIHRPR